MRLIQQNLIIGRSFDRPFLLLAFLFDLMYNKPMNKYELLGFDIDSVSMKEAIEISKNLIDSNKVTHIVTINPEMYELAEDDYEFAQIIRWADLVVPDGVGVTLGLKLMGHTAQRIAGIDLAYNLLLETAKNEIPVALIGAKTHVLENAVANLKKQISGLNIVYARDGYFDDIDVVYEELRQTSPKLVLVAMGAPMQEKFINNAKKLINPALMIGVGGSFDVWGGEVLRAPSVYRKLGLEWLYRTIKQPERFSRIFPTIPYFLYKIINEKLGV